MKYFTYCVAGLLIFIITPAKSYAQKKDSSKKYTLNISPSAEFAHLDFSDLNNSLANHDLPAVKQQFFSSFSLWLFPLLPEQRPFFGINYEATQVKKRNANYVTRLNLNLLEANFYYTIWYSRRSMLYPGFGFGWMNYKLSLQDKSKTPVSFDDALNDFQGATHLETDDYFLNFSIAYNWALDPDRDFLIGAHAGYRLGLNKPHWKLDSGEDLSGAPASSASGFYVGIDFIIL